MATFKSGVSSRERAYRNAFIITLALFLMHCIYDMTKANTAVLRTTTSQVGTTHLTDADHLPTISSRVRMLEITENNTDFKYFPKPDILFMTMAKGGTTSTLNWLYYGMAGSHYNRTDCATYVQDVTSHCWDGHAIHLYKLSEDEQWRILTSAETLRVAIQRNPFERLVSSWKSKCTCDDDVYGTDLRNRNHIVPGLLRRAGMPDDKNCLSISEFAETLEALRTRVGSPGVPLKSLRQLDVHVRPQDFFFDEVKYDLVLDVKDLGNVTYLKPIIERLPRKDLEKVQLGPSTMHASTGEELPIPERAAKLLHLFAMESKWGKTKYML